MLSFVNLGIYWNNHHHLLMATKRVNGAVLWANLHLLFWLSLFPFAVGLYVVVALIWLVPDRRIESRIDPA